MFVELVAVEGELVDEGFAGGCEMVDFVGAEAIVARLGETYREKFLSDFDM